MERDWITNAYFVLGGLGLVLMGAILWFT